MNLLAKLFSLGRVGPSVPGRTGGWLAPTRGAQIDLKETAFEAGCVQLVTGEWRCVALVTGWPLHARDAGEALSFLSQIATALNKAPSRFTMLARSYPGGLERYANDRRARSREGGPLAKIARDQSQHAVEQMAEGRYRQHGHFLVTSGRTQREASDRMVDMRRTLKEAGVETRLPAGMLPEHIANSWRPDFVEHFVLDYNGPNGEALAVLAYSPRAAVARYPRFVDPALPVEQNGRLPERKRKALAG